MKSEIERRRHRRAVNTLGRLVFTTLGPLTLGLLLAAYSLPAHADTITVVGTPGTPGVDGAPGTNGGPGGDATATAGPNSDPSNTASAIGGAGGKGGASTDIGVPSGNGGAAGNATATAARIQPKTCRPDLRPHSGGWRCAEGNLPGHKHAGAIDPVQLAATASRVCTKVYVRKKISDSRPVRGRDRGDQG